MSKYQQLLDKAMSTDSPGEAFNCIQMAKKYKPTAKASSQPTKINGKTIIELASEYDKLLLDTKMVIDRYYELKDENKDLREKVKKLKKNESMFLSLTPVFAFLVFFLGVIIF